jgi:hypothetical protein
MQITQCPQAAREPSNATSASAQQRAPATSSNAAEPTPVVAGGQDGHCEDVRFDIAAGIRLVIAAREGRLRTRGRRKHEREPRSPGVCPRVGVMRLGNTACCAMQTCLLQPATTRASDDDSAIWASNSILSERAAAKTQVFRKWDMAGTRRSNCRRPEHETTVGCRHHGAYV